VPSREKSNDVYKHNPSASQTRHLPLHKGGILCCINVYERKCKAGACSCLLFIKRFVIATLVFEQGLVLEIINRITCISIHIIIS